MQAMTRILILHVFFLKFFINSFIFKKKNSMHSETNSDLWKIGEDIKAKFGNCVAKCINIIYKSHI